MPKHSFNPSSTGSWNRGCRIFSGRNALAITGRPRCKGLPLLRGEKRRLSPFMRKLALSAAQSVLFNRYLAQRMADGLLHQVLPGEVMGKYPAGGIFLAEDVTVEQRRFDNREVVPAGPIFGRKMFAARDSAAQRETKILDEAGLTLEHFAGFGKLTQGTRRHNLVFLQDLKVEFEQTNVCLSFSLPSGSYATVLLRELTKNPEGDDNQEEIV
ncbi:MAG: hypothetical protein KatS3mg105_4531 [Gemmatales bacterium]|nr:MAG: hypothetical protein KatS3mg105_4531 [Gemmatales bacterium]